MASTSVPQAAVRHDPLWLALFLGSGAVSLVYEVVWLRRLGLVLGSSAVASAVTLGVFMAGLALGAGLSSLMNVRSDRQALRIYAALEAGAAVWALAFPWMLMVLTQGWAQTPGLRWVVAVALLLPPTTLLGATWPVLAARLQARGATGLYAANTTGAVIGVLGSTFLLLPMLGVRGTEMTALVGGVVVAVVAWQASTSASGDGQQTAKVGRLRAPLDVLLASGVAGLSALGLEVVWMRLAAVGLGGSVQNIGVVLATFLLAVAVGAWIGRSWPRDPRKGLAWSLAALGMLALAGAAVWGQLPYLVAAAYEIVGPEGMVPASALIASVAMGGAPVASGVAFSCAVRLLDGRLEGGASQLYVANTVGSIVGAAAGGLWVLPSLEVRGAVILFAVLAALAGAVILRRPWPVLPVLVLVWLVPGWDARLYAVGVHLRVSDFADPSMAAIRRYADEGWELELYDHGATGAVAVGRSTRTGNVWLSVNGKVDASTGDDMPTQELSGHLPLAASDAPDRVLLVGLASGVTAGAVLADDRVQELVLAELEPAIVRASHHFDHVNGRPLEDPRTKLVLDDARAVLQRETTLFDVIISEPSNPWISGVSNLFTAEYWQLAKSHLKEDGVFCQWVQLYGMGPSEFRALVRTFTHVFGDVWLFETIPGSDILLVAGPRAPRLKGMQPTLTPDEVRTLGGRGWLNTDDHPRIEWRAPRYLHYDTSGANSDLIDAARD